MNSIGAIILALLILVVFSAPRRWALMGMMASVLYLTQAQQLNLGGFNMFAIRFIELAGFIRVLVRREFVFQHLNPIDKALIWLYGYTTIIFLLRSTEEQAYQIGLAVDAFLCYFTIRGLLINLEDLYWFLRTFIFLLAPYTLLVLIESRTGHNPFDILGGIEGGSNWMRNGRPRCFGSFREPDTLGMFAGSFIPLYIGMACIVKERWRALFAIGLCLVVIWAANSGGAASAAATGLGCWGFWYWRTKMRKVRWGIVFAIVGLALVMKAPVWYIFEHVSDITGGDGWHRSYLIDVSYQHLGGWWFAGIDGKKTADWFPDGALISTGTADITNQYISFGLAGGLVATALFILLLARAFSNLGKALAVVRSSSRQVNQNEFLLWGLGVMLMVHIIDWFGVCYFDQMYMVWFMQLAAISSISEEYIAKSVALKSVSEAMRKLNKNEQIPLGSAI